MNKIIVYILYSFIFTYTLSAQEKMSFSLQGAQHYAIKHNYEVKNAVADVEIARRRVHETTAIGLPQIKSTVGYNNFLELSTQLIPAKFFDPDAPEDATIGVQFGTKHNISADITATQLIFSGPYLVGLQAAQTYKKFSEQNVQKTERDIKASIATSYYLVLLSESMTEIVKQNLDNINRILEETKKIYEEGFTEETNVDQLKITANTLNNQVNLLKRSTKLAYKSLQLIMGIDFSKDIELSDNMEILLEEVLLTDQFLPSFQVKENTDFQIINTQVGLNKLNLKKEKYEYLPSLSAFFTYKQDAYNNKFEFFDNNQNWFNTKLLGFSLNIPIFSSGSRKAIINKRKLELIKSKNVLLQFEQGLNLQYEQAKSNFITAYENYLVEKDNLSLSKKIYDKTVIKHREGISNSLELTQTNDQYLQVQASYTNAIIEMLNAKVELEKLVN